MEAGAVTFHDRKKINKIDVTKDKEILKRILKTKEEVYPDLKSNKHNFTIILEYRGERWIFSLVREGILEKEERRIIKEKRGRKKD